MGPPTPAVPQVFLSSTRRDMDACPAAPPGDIRTRARGAIQSAGGCPVAMEVVATDHVHSWDFCLDMLRRSTHYVGVFGYRRGWCPPGFDGRSVTEAEYDWAVRSNHQGDGVRALAVFVPDEGAGDAWERLAVRADGQTAGEYDAQRAFLDRVRRSAVNTFRTFDDLVFGVFQTVYRWRHGGLRDRHAGGVGAAADPRPYLSRLGRALHAAAFRDTVRRIDLGPDPRAGCFVVHGPDGAGHEYLVDRCCGELGPDPLRRVTVPAAVVWREPTAAGLARAVGDHLHLDPAVDSPAALARGLISVLARADAVIDVHGVLDMEGGLDGFTDGFWRPLVAGLLSTRPRGRLLTFARVDAPAAGPAGPAGPPPAARPIRPR